jgi:hypothetical protein
MIEEQREDVKKTVNGACVLKAREQTNTTSKFQVFTQHFYSQSLLLAD